MTVERKGGGGSRQEGQDRAGNRKTTTPNVTWYYYPGLISSTSFKLLKAPTLTVILEKTQILLLPDHTDLTSQDLVGTPN